jgi:hypothetical protein
LDVLNDLTDISSIVGFLNAISSIAVIAGAIFVVFQLRQNAKLTEATIRETKANISLALLEKITEESFPRRRKAMRDAVKKALAVNWEGFDDSLDDFEARNFAYSYELIGQLARAGTADLTMILDALQYLVVFDWNAFEPLVKHLKERYSIVVNPWGNFEWLAKETKKHMERKDANMKATPASAEK